MIKFRKLNLVVLTIACFLVHSVSMAQSKEDTLTWLRQSIISHMVPFSDKHSNIELVRIDECELVFDYTYKSERFQSTLPMKIKSLKDVGGFVPMNNSEQGFMFKGKVIVTRNLDTQKTYKHKYFGSVKIRIPESEKNLSSQIQNTMLYLADLCKNEIEQAK